MRWRKVGGRSRCSGAGHLATLSSWAADPLRDLGELTSQVPFNSAFMPQAKRLGVIDDAESSNGGQKKCAADHQKQARSSGARYLQDYQNVSGSEQHGKCKREHAN